MSVAFEGRENKIVSGHFSALTYNIAGLPEIISSAKTSRKSSIAEIGRKINDYDIVNVQEDFNYNHYLYNSGNIHPNRTPTKGKVPFGDGLNTLSHFNMSDVIRTSWRRRSGSDRLTPKGFSLVEVEITPGYWLAVYNVHANAQMSQRAVRSRRDNLMQLAEFIDTYTPDRALLVMGDFNAHYSYSDDNMHDFMSHTKLTDSWVDLLNGGRAPEINHQFLPKPMLSITNELESIDKILFRGDTSLQLQPQNYNVEADIFQNETQQALSDHIAVAIQFNWALTI